METTKSKNGIASSLMAVIGGMEKHFPNSSITVAGKSVKTTTIVGGLQAQVDALNASTAGKAAWLLAVQQQREQSEAVVKPYLAAIRHYVIVMFGVNSQEYLD